MFSIYGNVLSVDFLVGFIFVLGLYVKINNILINRFYDKFCMIVGFGL